MSVIVRDSVEADVAAIQAIYAHHVLHGVASFELEPPDLAETRARWAKSVGAGLPFLVACPQTDPTRVVGFAYAAPFHRRPAYAHTFEDSVYIAPGVAGRGVGAILLNGVLHELRHTQEVRQIVALIADSGDAASIALHKKLLFQPVGKLHKVGHKFGRELDVIIMQRNIAPLESR